MTFMITIFPGQSQNDDQGGIGIHMVSLKADCSQERLLPGCVLNYAQHIKNHSISLVMSRCGGCAMSKIPSHHNNIPSGYPQDFVRFDEENGPTGKFSLLERKKNINHLVSLYVRTLSGNLE